jgi:hypothetical protein
MVRIITTAAALIIIASSALAATPHASPYTRHNPMLGYSAADPSVVSIDGAYVGRDPDLNIRAELRRFPGPYVTGGF